MAAGSQSGSGSSSAVRSVGRYVVYGEIAQGGMATVHLGRLRGAAGFTRIVAIKRLHSQYAKDPEFVRMFTDEARLAARVRHPNVVPTLDVVSQDGELFLVMEYVHGETLARLIVHSRRAGSRVPPAIACSILGGALHGLHAAHEAVSPAGEPLHIVHRDVSPQNILVGTDGIARVLDFGIAKAAGRMHQTEAGVVKGKMGYMSPEQLYGERLDRRTDTYAAGVVLWESLVCDRLFAGDGDEPALAKMLSTEVKPPSLRVPGLLPALDAVVLRAVDRDRGRRFGTALEMALALERATQPATSSEVGAWVAACAGEAMAPRARLIAELEKHAEENEESDPNFDTMVARRSAISAPPSVPASMAAASDVSAGAPAGFSPGVTVTAMSPRSVDEASPNFGAEARPLAGTLPTMDGETTVATTVMPMPSAKRETRKALPVLIAAGAGVLVGGLFAVRSFLGNNAASSGGAAPGESGSAAASAAPAPSTQAAAPSAGVSGEPSSIPAMPQPNGDPATEASSAPSAASTAAAAPLAVGASTASAAPSGAGATKPRVSPGSATSKPTAKPAETSCNPPYTIDANGHKRYKRECLR